MKDNPEVFDNQDTKTFIANWFGNEALEVLDKDSTKLRCGVGHGPGASCIGKKCSLVDVCVHKNVKPVTPVKSVPSVSKKEKTPLKLVPSPSKHGDMKIDLT